MLWPGLTGTAVGALAAAVWPYTVDDAFITARFAENLAAGHGYGMNPGQPADGVTGPLWVLPGLLAAWLGLDAVAAAKLVGALCAAAAAALAVRLAGVRAGGRIAAPFCGLALVLSPSLGTWGVAGLETGAASLAVVLAHGAAWARPRPRGVATGLAVAALAWLRPELAPWAALTLGATWLREPDQGVRAAALAGVGAMTLLVVRLAYFGDALPPSYHAKAGDLGVGVRYVLTSVALATSGVGALVAGYGAVRGRREDAWLGAGLLVHLLAVALAGGDWMPGYRLLVPVLPLYALLLGRGVAVLWRRSPPLAVGALALSCLLPALDLATRVPALHATARSRTGEGAAIAEFLKHRATRVALVDVGFLGRASGLPVVDLGGVTDASIARLPGGHLDKRIDGELLQKRQPDAIVLHSARRPAVDAEGRLRALSGYPVEQRVAALPWVREHFRVARVGDYAPGYYYVVLLSTAAHGTKR
ncbi:MAG: hypothetical protein PVI30_22320 [Myxococcales bacterium]